MVVSPAIRMVAAEGPVYWLDNIELRYSKPHAGK